MSKIYIIAEAGVNHNGSLEVAKGLVEAAKNSGADAVKFQTFKAERLVSKTAQKAEYQKKNTDAGESQLEMIRKLELGYDSHIAILAYCRQLGIDFLSTAFDLESIDFLRELGTRRWKIPSGEITNLPYLRKVASFDEDILLSTGMAKLGEVESAIEALETAGASRSKITVLHCTTEYPAPIDEVNLLAMRTMGHAFGLAYGYSDHTQGIAIPIGAAALGATVIEKHFTLDRRMDGPDHKASLEPDELEAMVHGIRAVERALGDGVKRPTRSEIDNIVVARKSIVASKPIVKGELFSEANLTAKRPGIGISPMEWDRVVGRVSDRDYGKDDTIIW